MFLVIPYIQTPKTKDNIIFSLNVASAPNQRANKLRGTAIRPKIIKIFLNTCNESKNTSSLINTTI